MESLEIVEATWPAPSSVVALTTTRKGGVSATPYASFNLAHHVGDQPEAVQRNRHILQNEILRINQEPQWLNQVHGIDVIHLNATNVAEIPTADASYTQEPQRICAVMTADCLPVLICNKAGTEVAAVHVGWRGCVAGILENTVSAFKSPASELLAWLGPCIGPEAFEVGAEVREAFVNQNPDTHTAFVPILNDKFLADLYQLGRIALNKAGVQAIYGGDYCTVSDQKRFFSYRRDAGKTGRMASLIYLEEGVRSPVDYLTSNVK